MDPKSDLLQVARHWLGTRGLLGHFLTAFTTVLRALLGFDETRRQQALSFAAALFVIALWHPASPSSSVSARRAPPCVAPSSASARPLLEALMQLARTLRQDARGLLRAWIARRWD